MRSEPYIKILCACSIRIELTLKPVKLEGFSSKKDLKIRIFSWDCKISLAGLISPQKIHRVAHCCDNWLRYRVQSLSWAKSLTPGFALINHFFEIINSVKIDCCAET